MRGISNKTARFTFICLVMIIFAGFSNPSVNAYESTGDGSESDPFRIRTAEQLDDVRNDLDAHYVLMNDIDLESYIEQKYGAEGWMPLSYYNRESFTGVFDGNNHTISGLRSYRPSENQVGLFGVVRNNGEVKNLKVIISSEIKGNVSVGGIAGYLSEGHISNCHVVGTVTGVESVGGLTGANNHGVIMNSYAQCSVTATRMYAGGFIGVNIGEIINCYSIGTVNRPSSGYRGGFAGMLFNGIVNSYYYIENSYYSDVDKEYYRTLEDMKLKSTFISWDFDTIWSIDEGNSTPQLRLAVTNTGDGSDINPYKIRTAEQVDEVRNELYAHYVLMNDIDLDSYIEQKYGAEGWMPLSYFNRESFTGVFDGNNHTISGLRSNRPNENQVGLFGVVGENGEVKNLRVVISDEIRGDTSVGGIVGYLIGGRISNCHIVGTVTGVESVGGLGGASSHGVISNSYAQCSVTATKMYAGGFIGVNIGDIINCYSVGTVNRPSSGYRGGFAGMLFNGIVNSYYYIEDTYYSDIDKEYYRTLEELKLKSTFLSWDFDTIWSIDEGASTPYLTQFAVFLGNGSEAYPYQIRTAEQLDLIRTDLDAHYILMNDIDLSNFIAEKNPIEGWEPLGVIEERFTGCFDGDGYTISGLYCNRPNTRGVGLFGFTWGTLKNTSIIISSSVIGHDAVGGLSGHITEGSVVSDCTVKGNVSGFEDVGGLFGYAYKMSIYNCSAEGIVEGTSLVNTDVGGLVGNTHTIIMDNCMKTGLVIGNDTVGGLIGRNDYSQLLNCYSDAKVQGDSSIGGLVGYHYQGDINKSLSTGEVVGSSNLGGLVGINNDGTIISSYYDMLASGQSDEGKGIPKKTENLMLKTTYDGWIFGSESKWDIYESFSYPFLYKFGSPIENPTLYVNVNDWDIIEKNSFLYYGCTDKNYVLTTKLLSFDGEHIVESGDNLNSGIYCLNILAENDVGNQLHKEVRFMVYDSNVIASGDPILVEGVVASIQDMTVPDIIVDLIEYNMSFITDNLISADYQSILDQSLHQDFIYQCSGSSSAGQLQLTISVSDISNVVVGKIYCSGLATTEMDGIIHFDFTMDSSESFTRGSFGDVLSLLEGRKIYCEGILQSDGTLKMNIMRIDINGDTKEF